MVRTHFISLGIVPPIYLDWAGDVYVSLNFGASTLAVLLVVALVAYVSATNR